MHRIMYGPVYSWSSWFQPHRSPVTYPPWQFCFHFCKWVLKNLAFLSFGVWDEKCMVEWNLRSFSYWICICFIFIFGEAAELILGFPLGLCSIGGFEVSEWCTGRDAQVHDYCPVTHFYVLKIILNTLPFCVLGRFGNFLVLLWI